MRHRASTFLLFVEDRGRVESGCAQCGQQTRGNRYADKFELSHLGRPPLVLIQIPLERFFAGFVCTDSDSLFHTANEDLAVADCPGVCR